MRVWCILSRETISGEGYEQSHVLPCIFARRLGKQRAVKVSVKVSTTADMNVLHDGRHMGSGEVVVAEALRGSLEA